MWIILDGQKKTPSLSSPPSTDTVCQIYLLPCMLTRIQKWFSPSICTWMEALTTLFTYIHSYIHTYIHTYILLLQYKHDGICNRFIIFFQLWDVVFFAAGEDCSCPPSGSCSSSVDGPQGQYVCMLNSYYYPYIQIETFVIIKFGVTIDVCNWFQCFLYIDNPNLINVLYTQAPAVTKAAPVASSPANFPVGYWSYNYSFIVSIIFVFECMDDGTYYQLLVLLLPSFV